MSQVTSVIILFSSSEDENKIINDLNEFEYKKGIFFSIKSIRDKSLPPFWYGGSKGFEATVLIGSYNYLKIVDLTNFMKTFKWEYIEDVQLLYKEEGDDTFKLINLIL